MKTLLIVWWLFGSQVVADVERVDTLECPTIAADMREETESIIVIDTQCITLTEA